MLVNSRKVGYRGWMTCLVLLTVLALSSCGKKSEDPTAANNSPNEPTAAQSSTPAVSTTPSKEPITTASATPSQEPTTTTSATPSKESTTKNSSKSTKSASKTLPAEAEKLGVKPQGTNCPSNAPIKGNINNKGNKIYHEAKEANYKQVKPEVCFADVATAQKAGFRSPKAAK
ncbi:MAG TPA: hypothetical protein V6D11_20765 [Waterburya sp.]|jgi:PBP1b-binding outer membrane lipoprotein LpoB